MIQELEQNNQTTKDFCMKMYPKFARYIQTYDLNKIDINASNPMTYINKISEDEILSLNDVNKIIQDLNSYSDDNGISLNFNSEFKNNDIMQVYNS